MEVENAIFDEIFFKNALRKQSENDTIEILSIEGGCASAKGLNFLSDMFRYSLKYRLSECTNDGKIFTVNLVIKTEPKAANCAKLVKNQGLFPTELQMLQEALPRIERIVGQRIGPMLLHSQKDPIVFVMEDLTQKGFVMKDRQIGFSLAHSILFIQQIARFHAGSIALCEKDPKLVKSFTGGIIDEKCHEGMLTMSEVSLLKISQAIQRWQVPWSSTAADKLIKLSVTIRSRCRRVYKYEPDEFCVLNHGDCWTNNIMFRENDKGEPLQVRMVDYQMPCYTSPAVDLIYFLCTCPDLESRYDKDDLLLNEYLKVLTSTMRSTGCRTKPPTMKELKDAMYKRRSYALFAGLVLSLRMVSDKEDTEDVDELLNKRGGQTRMDVFKSETAVKIALKMIPAFDARGYLD